MIGSVSMGITFATNFVVQRQTIAGLLKKMFDLSIKSAEKKL
jgi:hypothetical protein